MGWFTCLLWIDDGREQERPGLAWPGPPPLELDRATAQTPPQSPRPLAGQHTPAAAHTHTANLTWRCLQGPNCLLTAARPRCFHASCRQRAGTTSPCGIPLAGACALAWRPQPPRARRRWARAKGPICARPPRPGSGSVGPASPFSKVWAMASPTRTRPSQPQPALRSSPPQPTRLSQSTPRATQPTPTRSTSRVQAVVMNSRMTNMLNEGQSLLGGGDDGHPHRYHPRTVQALITRVVALTLELIPIEVDQGKLSSLAVASAAIRSCR